MFGTTIKNTVTFTCGGREYRSDALCVDAEGFRVESDVRAFPEYGAVYERHIISGPAGAESPLIGAFTDADLLLPLEDVPRSLHERTAGTALRVVRMHGTVTGLGDVYGADDLLSATEYGLVEDFLRGKRSYSNTSGRSSDGTFPLFDVTDGENGYILFLGWTGSWKAEFEPAEGGVRAVLGLKNGSFRLPAGESLQTLSTLIMAYRGGRKAARNRFRRLLREHFSVPGQPGRPEHAMSCFELWGGLPSGEMCRRVGVLRDAGVRFDHIWVDAGWYGDFTEESKSPFEGTWSQYTGDWRINPNWHPDGMREVARHIREAGMGFDLWVEPERNVRTTPPVAAHPEWYTIGEGRDAMIDYGNPEAWRFVYDTLCGLIDGLGPTVYRQDFNTDASAFWSMGRTPEEAALAELRHINGMYRLWDALLERYPHLLIDNCSSGGRRIDLETVRRAVPFFRSDYNCSFTPDPDVCQCQNVLAEYLPYNGCSTKTKNDDYAARSSYSSAWGLACWNTAFQTMDGADLRWAARISAEYARLRPYFSRDFYSLASAGYDKTSWTVWQYDRPEQGDGVILGFRRADSGIRSMAVTPGGLADGRAYVFTDLDTGEERTVGPEELAQGLVLTIPEKRMSRVWTYRAAE